jgi:hypothetical protein
MAYLVVPIDVEALCVNGQPIPNGLGFMPAVTNFDRLPYAGQSSPSPFLGERAMAQPFNGGSAMGQPGIHLHWAMPDALMHGERKVDSQGKPVPRAPLQFRKLPDRWLVTRAVLGKPELTQSWIVDSRYVSQTISQSLYNVGSSAIPWENPNDLKYRLPPYRYLGRTVPLQSWASAQAGAEYLPKLNATSMAVIQGPAYYPNARNVFGMYDARTDSQPFEVCYSVCGWHVSPADDPLNGKNAAEAAEILKTCRWRVSDSAVFEGVIYTGMVLSAEWDPSRTVRAASRLTATFGNTTIEALSALLAIAAGEPAPAFEPQLHALLSGQLDILPESGGDRRVTRQLHQQRFAPVVSGNVSFVARKSDGGDVSSSLPVNQCKLLDDLNRKEQDAVGKRDDAAANQWQLFADWCKYLKCAYPESGQTPPLDPDDVRQYIQRRSLPEAQKSVATYQTALADANKALRDLINVIAADFELAVRPGPNYWNPVDPVLLLQGTDVQPAMRYGGDGLFACRTTDQMLTALTLPAGAVPNVGGASLDRSASSGLGGGAGAAGAIETQASSALLEACLFWPNHAGAALASRAGQLASANAIAQWISSHRSAFLAGGPGPWTGTAPATIGVTAWSGNPWLPILMHWRISYQPLAEIPSERAAQTFNQNALLSRLSADNDSLDADAVDLVLTGGVRGEIKHYEGITFITPQAGLRPAQQLVSYTQHRPQSLLTGLAQSAGTMPMLSQSLAGFHDRLLLRRQTAKVEIRDPFAKGSEVNFVRNVREALMALDTGVTTMAPMVQDAFSPVRGGGFDLDELLLVDVFGQFKTYKFNDLQMNAVLASKALSPVQGSDARAFFPPRLSQSARLEFRWISADDDKTITTASPATSPICGWVVPNYLDASLVIYNASGEALGSIMAISGKLRWLNSPANPTSFSMLPEQVFANRNKHLRGFVMAFLRHGDDVQYLIDYLNTLNRVMNTIQPSQFAQHAQLPILVGQPLALTRASLTLNFMGLPAVNETWAAFTKDVQAAQGRTTNAHEEIRYPVLLGNVNDPDDGLAGFYLDSAQDPYATFYAVAGVGKGISPRRIQSITLAPSEAPATLTMLIDPRSEVHVTSGYAPSQSLSVPSEMFKAAFEKLSVTFLTAPVLTMEPPPTDAKSVVSLPLPLPGQQKGKWKWIRVVNAKGQQSAILAQAQNVKPAQVLTNASVYLQEGWLSLGGFED